MPSDGVHEKSRREQTRGGTFVLSRWRLYRRSIIRCDWDARYSIATAWLSIICHVEKKTFASLVTSPEMESETYTMPSSSS